MFTRQDEIHSHQTRSVGEGNLFIPQRNVFKEQEAVSYADAKLWNEIPLDIKRAQSVDTFIKEKLKQYLLSSISKFEHVNH